MRKLTLLISMLFLSLGMAWAQNYTPRVTGVKENTKRLVGSISVGGDSYSLPDGTRYSYKDATDEKTFTVWAGETISLGMTQSKGSWMHAFVYIDQDKNGFTAGIGTDGYTPTGDLVSYSFYNNGATSDASGYNSVGKSISGGYINTLSLPDIVAPTTPGTYRIRFKYDWCNIDPAGGEGTYFGGTFTGHGGEIIDATLIVDYHFEFVKSGRPTKWYNVALHPDQMNYISVNASGQATATTSLDGSMNSIWGFVGNPIDGFKLVNAAGKELVFGSPATVADENGTVFKVVKSTYGGSGFALQAPNSNNQCLNPQGGLVKSWTLDRGCTVVLQETTLPAVAQVDGVEYATLAEAVAAASAGATITFVADVNESVTLSKNVTIDGANFKYTGTMTGSAGLTVTVQNVNFVNGGFAKTTKSSTGTYTFKECTFDGAENAYPYPLAFKGAKTVNVEDCMVKDYQYSFLYISSGATKVNVKKVTVEDCPDYAVYFASGVNTATFEELTVKRSSKGFLINNTANRSLTIKDCKMENVNTAIAESKGTSAITANVQGVNNDFGTAVLSQYAKCVLAEDATLAATTADLNVTTDVEGKVVAYQGGKYSVAEKFYAAKVGDVKYETLAAAVEAAEAGGTVTLIADATGAGVVINKNLTIDFGGKTYTANAGVGSTGTQTLALQILKGNDVTLQNGTLTSEGENIKMLVQNYANLTVDNMKLVDATDAIQYVLSNNSGDVNVINGSVISSDAVALDACKYASYAKPEVTVAEGVIVNGNVEVSATLNMNGTLNGAIVINGAEGVVNGAEGLTVTSTVDDHELVYKDGAYKVVEKFYAAEVGGQKYETLAAAVEAAEAGATVELLNDATGAGVVINKNLTIDFGGKTYTANAGVGSAGTQTLALQILKGNDVTLQNGTLTSEGENIKMLVQNYANLTVNNMQLVDATDAIQYVLSNNSGTVEIVNGTEITANGAIALDACKYASYAAPTVNVAEGVKVTGNVEVSATLNMNGTLSGNIVINGTAGVVNGAEGLTVITDVADHKVVRGENGDYTIVEKQYVAQVSEANKYETFAAAVAAVKNGETIKLLQAVAESVTIKQTAGKSFTIDGDGNDFTGKITVNGNNRSTGAESITFKNVNFSGGNKSYLGNNSSHNVAFENCTFESKSSYYMHSESAIYNYSFIDCKVTGNGAFSQFTKAVNNLYVENFVSECSGNTFKIDYCATSTSVKTATFKNVEIKSGVVGFYISNRNYGKVVFEDVKANCQYPVYMWDRGTGIKTPLEFNGVNEFVTTAEKPWLTGENAANITAAAMIAIENGNKVYDSFDKALEDVKAGETLTLLRDVTASEIVTIDKAITLDGNGNTLTSTATRAINVDCAGKVAIKNLTVATASSTERAINVINKPATLTLENVVAEGFKYTINVAATSVGSKIAINGGKYSGYAALNITANNTTVNAVDAAFVGVNNEPTAETNSYAAINIGDGLVEGATAGVTVNVSGNSTITAQRSNEEGKGNDEYILIAQDVENAKVSLDAELGITDGKVVMIDDIMDANVEVRAEYADALNAQGFATAIKDNGMAVIKLPVAKIDNKSYASLAEAVKAAKDGNTITLLQDVTENVTITATVTLDGDNHTITGNILANGKGKYVTIKNVNFNGNDKAIGYAVRADNGNRITIDNCTATGYSNGLLYANKNNNNITVKNVVIENCGLAINLVSYNNATFQNVVINDGGYGVQTQNAGTRNITFDNCTMENVQNPVTIYEKTGNTAKVNFKFIGDNDFGATFKLGKYAVVNGAVFGGTKIYASLPEAVAASNDIKLMANTTGAGAVIDEKLEFDLCGYAYTFTEGVGSTGTESNGLQILKGNDVTLKNGTLNVAEDAADKFYILVQNYANLTVEGMTLDGKYLDKWSLTDGDSYVLSNNSGNVVIKGETNITANNDGDKAFAFDACDKTANGYTLPVVTVETTGKIDGQIENTATIVIYSGTYTMDVTPWCAPAYVCQPNEDGTLFSVVFDPSYGMAAKVDDVYYKTFDEAYEAANGVTIELLSTVVLSPEADKTYENATVKAIFGNEDVAFRIQGGNTVTFNNMNVEADDYCFIVGEKEAAANLVINGGNYKGETSIASVTMGNLTVTDGTFKVAPYEGNYNYTFNCYDANYKNGKAAVVISGGKFYNFNPADNAAEGEGTSFVAPGYVTGADAEGWWTVAEPVAVIGETGYISINHAFAAAKDGDTVTMNADVELGFADAVLNDAGHKVLAKVAGKNITFDMNGKKISVDHRSTNAAERIFAVICVEDGAGLTVTGEGYIDITTGITDANTMPKVAYMFWKRGTTGYLVIENGNFHMDNSEDSMVYTNGDQIVTVKGGTFTLDAVGLRVNKDGFPWIFNADGRNDRSIVVTGGTYNCYLPEQTYEKEVLIPEEFLILPNDNGTWTVMGAAAHIGNSYYSTFAKAYEEAVDGDVIELTRTAVVTEDMTLNKNVTVKAAFDDIAIRVQDGATVDFAGTSVESDDYCVILGSSDKATAGYVNISAGTFKGETTAVSVTKGNLNITGGEFQVEPYEGSYVYTINCYDASYNSGDATVAITGGKFYNFNPADNAAEGAGTNFIPEAKRDVVASGVDAEGWWTVAPAVAEVAGNVYISLVDAVAAAGNNDVVTLLQSVTGAGVVINKSITIDFGGYTYTANEGVGSKDTETLGLQILKGNDVTLKNGTLTSEGENIKMLVQNYANLTVDNMKLVDATDAIQYVLSNNSGDVVVKNGSEIIADGAIAFDACKYANYALPTVTVEEGVKVTGNVEVSATLNMEGTLYGAIVINGKDGVVNAAAEGLTVTTNIADYKVVYADGAYTVIPKDYIAQVGNVKYEYIDEAVAAGNYVTILKDFTAAGLVIDKDLTIDFAGHTYTFNEAVGKYNGLLINKGKNVTLKNGTLNVAPEAAGKFYTIIQNYANLTIEDMHLDGTNLDMWALTDGDSYVLTSNSGKVDIKGNTNITANNNGDNAYAFNAYDKTAEGYSATKVTVETTGFINGKIEKTGNNPSIVIKSGRYIFNVTKWCADGVAAVEQTDGTWLVTSVVAKVQNNDGVYGFATLPAAVAAADEDATITLMADVTLDEVIKVEKKLTFELGNKTITANCRKAFEIYADATFRYGTINAVNRCIDTRTKVNLTLYDVTLNANDYTPEYGNPQPLTIGGYDNGTKVTMQYSHINAKDGYGIITFVKSTVNINTYSSISGYNALYAKEGSAGSVFNVNSSTLTGDCRDNDVEGNSFSAIAIQENNVTVIVNSSSTVNANGNNMYAVSIGNEEDTSWTGNVVEIKGYINGNILDVENLEDNRVTVRVAYADRLLDEGYSYDKVDNYYIRAKKLVVLDSYSIVDNSTNNEADYEFTEPLTYVKEFTYTRNFDKFGIWRPLYVPFEIPVSALPDNFEVAYINDVHAFDNDDNGEIDDMEMEVLKIKNSDAVLKANHPYLIRAKSSSQPTLTIKLKDIYLQSATDKHTTITCSSVYLSFDIRGTFKKASGSVLTGGEFYALNNVGDWRLYGESVTLGAYRLYQTLTVLDGAPFVLNPDKMPAMSVRAVGEENEDGTTTIYDVPEEVETEDMIFDLHGRRVLETEKGGIYIKNGKKFIAQ